MRLRREPAIQIKTPAQIARMYEAGQVVARTLAALADAVRPGVTTAELDSIRARDQVGRRGPVLPWLLRVPGVDLRVG